MFFQVIQAWGISTFNSVTLHDTSPDSLLKAFDLFVGGCIINSMNSLKEEGKKRQKQ